MRVSVKFTDYFLVAPTVRFSRSNYSVNEDDRSVQLVLVLNDETSSDIAITVSSTDISAEGKSTVCMFT